ncbi:MAG: lysophospholipid acyltransferase family protein [Planctomycetota bacterium]
MLSKRERLIDVITAASYWLGRSACRVFCLLLFHLRSYGRENVPKEGAFLLVCNHQSYLDPIFCGVPLRRQLYYVARSSLFKHWFFGRLISTLKTIPVKRGQADLAAMRKVVARLKEGRPVCLFPEGTRTSDGRIAAFKGGLGFLSRRGRAPIVPVVIDGAFENWPRHKRMFSPGGHIGVYYGKAISAERARAMSDDELAAVVTETLRRMQHELRIKRGKEPYDY